MLVDFFQEYISEEDFYPVRDVKRIAIHYIRRRFILDLLAVIPWDTAILKDPETKQLMRLFKLLRLPKLFLILDSRNFNAVVKAYYENRLKRVIKDP